MNHVFGLEWEELGQGTAGRKAYQGQAILTALGTRSARVIQFRAQSAYWQPRWFMPNWALFQRRDGGRIAQVLEVESGGRPLVLYNVHLESRGSEELRRLQMEELLADLRQHPADTAVVVAGDFNTRVADAPAVKLLRAAGFRQAAGGRVTTMRGAALDWIFVRGPVVASEGRIHDHVHASDHYPLTARLRWEDTRQSE
jgi:endonuclease/exonuclease/phosphatase family metal-dependent hydrolase